MEITLRTKITNIIGIAAYKGKEISRKGE